MGKFVILPSHPSNVSYPGPFYLTLNLVLKAALFNVFFRISLLSFRIAFLTLLKKSLLVSHSGPFLSNVEPLVLRAALFNVF